jgi:hypothetical protein
MTWAQVITLGAAIIGAMWALFKWGLDGELKTVRAQLEMILEKVGKVDALAGDVKEMQTVMRMNGCMDTPTCARRKGDA